MDIRYLDEVKMAVGRFDPKGENRYFVFGSATRVKKIHDIDLGVAGNSRARKRLDGLRDILYNAPVPYKVDVVDMDEADVDFRDYVMNAETKIWI